MPDPTPEVYDRLAPIYDRRWHKYEEATLGAALVALGCRGDEWLLDVASGTGELERRLLARWPGLRIVGADLSAGMLAEAVQKELGPGVFWVRAGAGRLPLRDAAFDMVVCINSFHYFRQAGAALCEMVRTLRPGGRLVLLDWCHDYLACRLCSWWLRFADPAFHKTYRSAECAAMLQEAGLEVVASDRFRVGWLWGLMRFVCHRGRSTSQQYASGPRSTRG